MTAAISSTMAGRVAEAMGIMTIARELVPLADRPAGIARFLDGVVVEQPHRKFVFRFTIPYAKIGELDTAYRELFFNYSSLREPVQRAHQRVRHILEERGDPLWTLLSQRTACCVPPKRGCNIGEVVVFKGPPRNHNPYVELGLCGDERVMALRMLKANSHHGSRLRYYHAPYGGGAHRITDSAAVNWETSGV